jgi:hypothetical protein
MRRAAILGSRLKSGPREGEMSGRMRSGLRDMRGQGNGTFKADSEGGQSKLLSGVRAARNTSQCPAQADTSRCTRHLDSGRLDLSPLETRPQKRTHFFRRGIRGR